MQRVVFASLGLGGNWVWIEPVPWACAGRTAHIHVKARYPLGAHPLRRKEIYLWINDGGSTSIALQEDGEAP